MNSKLLKLLPLLIAGLVILVIGYMYSNQPQGKKRPSFDKALEVEVKNLIAEDYEVVIESFGVIEAATSGNLVAQVSGLITEVSEQFATGLSFKAGDELVVIDDRDYRIEVTIAKAELANARLALQQEKALAEQALRDWNKINPNKKAPSLVLRKPQVASAQAKLDAANARLKKALLALSRTRIKAPYEGQIIQKQADLGQLVTPNTPLASIFSNASLEVRLPVPANKIQFLPALQSKKTQHIELSADFGGLQKVWQASLDRTDSVIDEATRQWYVTAKLDPVILKNEPLLKVGQFVNAKIEGKKLSNVFVLDAKLVTQDDEVFLYQGGKLKRQTVSVIWRNDQEVVIDQGLDPDQQLITTPLAFVADGAKLTLKSEAVKQRRNRQSKSNSKVSGAKP